MDGPFDPLATARTGGLDSVAPIEEEISPGVLGEVFMVDEKESRTAEHVRGIKLVQLACNRNGRCVALDVQGCAHDLSNGEIMNDVPLESIAFSSNFLAGIGLHDSRLYTWGSGEEGRLGLGHTRGSEVPEVVPNLDAHEIKQVSCGSAHSLALSHDGVVFSWGRGIEGQLGQGVVDEVNLKIYPHMAFRLVPRMVQGLHRVHIYKIGCGSHFSAALDTNGSVWTWGQGLCGQLGMGRCTARNKPSRVLGPCKGESARSGNSQTTRHDKLSDVETVEDYLDILPEEARKTLGLESEDARLEADDRSHNEKSDQSCSNVPDLQSHRESNNLQSPQSENIQKSKILNSEHPSEFQLNLTTLSSTSSASASHDESGNQEGVGFYVDLACGDSHVLVLDKVGFMMSWGLNSYGQLGTGDLKSRFEPTQVCSDGGSLPRMQSVSACGHASGSTSMQSVPYTWGLGISKGKTTRVPQKLIVRKDKPDARVGLAHVSAHAGALILIPTLASAVHPSNGPLEGGHEVAISGVGFWESGSIKVRFVPMQKKVDVNNQNEANDTVNNEEDTESEHLNETLSDDGLDLDDAASTVSSDSGQSHSNNKDPRQIEIVDGKFDPLTGNVICIAPASVVAGVTLVQVAIDGSTFTSDEIFYIYTEPCALSSVASCLLSCSADDRSQTSVFSVNGTGLFAMPELCIRLAFKGKQVFLPASLKGPASQATASDVEDQVSERENSREFHEILCVEAKFNINDVIDALGGFHSGDVDVNISLNGITFAKTEHLSVEHRTCTLTRPQVEQVVPWAFPCKDPTGSEKTTSNKDEFDVNGLAPVEIYMSGLVKQHSGSIVVRMTESYPQGPNEGPDALPKVYSEVSGQLSQDLSKILFQPHIFQNCELPNGQGWGHKEMRLAISLNGGISWSWSPKPFYIYAGNFLQPFPCILPSTGCEIEIKTRDSQPGWVFQTSNIKLEFTADQRSALPPTKAAQTKVEQNGSLIRCSTGDLHEVYVKVREYMRQQLHARIFEEYLAQNFQEPTEENESTKETREVELAEARKVAESVALEKSKQADHESVKFTVRVAVNGRDFLHSLGTVEIFEQPVIRSIQPECVTQHILSDGEAQEEIEELKSTDASSENLLSLTLESRFYLPSIKETSIVRFLHATSGHVYDAPVVITDNSESDTENENSTTDDEQPGSLFTLVAHCQIPQFHEPGDYMISIALNGQDFTSVLTQSSSSDAEKVSQSPTEQGVLIEHDTEANKIKMPVALIVVAAAEE